MDHAPFGQDRRRCSRTKTANDLPTAGRLVTASMFGPSTYEPAVVYWGEVLLIVSWLQDAELGRDRISIYEPAVV